MGRGGWASPTYRIQYYMKKYSPYENCSCISNTDQRSRARSRTDPSKLRVLCGPWLKRVGTVAYISNGVEHASAEQYDSYGITESYEDTINHFPDKKSGMGGWDWRWGAASGGILQLYNTVAAEGCCCCCFFILLHHMNRQDCLLTGAVGPRLSQYDENV